jgi:hypothetical protein
MNDKLVVALPEAALELVRPYHESVLARPDVEEQRLHGRVIPSEQNILQTGVEFAPVEPSGDDPGDEWRPVRAGEQDENRPADQTQQRFQGLFVPEL